MTQYLISWNFSASVHFCSPSKWSAKEQRIIIKFLVKLKNSVSEIQEKLQQVYQETAMQPATVYKWAKRFKEGRSTSRNEENLKKVFNIVLQDRRITAGSIAEQLSISKTSVKYILSEDLLMRKLCAKMVPKMLTIEQKQRRVDCCNNITTVEHPAYSPDLAPCDFFLFPKIKKIMRANILGMCKQFKAKWRVFLRDYPKRNCSFASNSGRCVGKSVYKVKGSTLRVIILLYLINAK